MSTWQQEALDLKQKEPKHILFLCVANSARSQMAEGIAKSLVSKNVKISSAGSSPSKLNPLATEVLSEIGIDINSQFSKAISDIDTSTVDAVITLCAEEVCPLFLGKAEKLHWGMPDPANTELSQQEQLELFRTVRNQLKERLIVLFS